MLLEENKGFLIWYMVLRIAKTVTQLPSNAMRLSIRIWEIHFYYSRSGQDVSPGQSIEVFVS